MPGLGGAITAASSLEDLTEQLDQAIVANTRLYPTHRYARALNAGLDTQDLVNHPTVRVLAAELDSPAPRSALSCCSSTATFGVTGQELGIG